MSHQNSFKNFALKLKKFKNFLNWEIIFVVFKAFFSFTKSWPQLLVKLARTQSVSCVDVLQNKPKYDRTLSLEH